MIPNVKIGAVTYNIKELDDLHDVDGEGRKVYFHGRIDYSEALVKIAEDQAHDVKVVTLWHELLHAILKNAGYDDHSETHIDALAYGLIQVMRDNRPLVDYTLYPPAQQTD